MRRSHRALTVGLVLGMLVLASMAFLPIAVPSSAPRGSSSSPDAEPLLASSMPNPRFHAAANGLPRESAVTASNQSPAPTSGPVPPVAPEAAPASPVIRSTWNGLGSSDNANLTPYPSVSPPDVQIAVGPTHVVEMVNLAVGMWTKQGVRVANSSLMAFFGTPTNEFISDPKVQYDAGTARWFATITDVATSSNVATGQVILAVSSSSDPTASWTIYKVPSTATGECLDQPILGVGNRTVIVSVNVFSTCLSNKFTYNGAQFWVLSKADLVSGAATPATQSFGPYANTASAHPAQVIGTSSTDFLVEANAFNTSVSSIQLLRVSGVPPSATVSTTSLNVRTIANPPAATQPGGGSVLPLDTGDFRVMDAAWSAQNLWLTLGDSCTPSGDTTARSCVRLIEVNTTTNTITQDFDVGSSGRYYLYPALRADGKGNLLVVFAYSSATDYPGVMAAGRVFGDPANQLDPPVVIMAGATDQGLGCTTSAGSCRYGDYFGAGLDPSNSGIIWAAGEFGVNSGWGTQIFAASVKAVLTLDYTIVNGGTGYSVPKLSYTLDGAARSATLGTTPTSYAADPGTTWGVPVLLLNPSIHVNTTSEVWMINASATAPAFSGTVNASFTSSFTYFHMYLFRFLFSVSDNRTGAVPMIQVQAQEIRLWAAADASYYVDANSNFSYPAQLNESAANERWVLKGPANGTVTGPDSFAGLYYHQYRVTFDYLLTDASSGPAPSVAYWSEGANTSVQANATVWADAAQPYVYAASLTPAGTGVRIGATAGTVGNVTVSRTYTVTYGLQYLLNVLVNPPALASNVSGGGWYNAGELATLTATAPNGWKFVGWSGAVSGTGSSATATMSGPQNVTALFYPGLTIVAGAGGSVAYSYGNASGLVPAGSTFVLYVPAGTAVTLVAQPSSWTDSFVSWNGSATGASTTIRLTVGGPATVSATFASDALLVAGVAAGVIAVLLAVVILFLVGRRRRKQPPT